MWYNTHIHTYTHIYIDYQHWNEGKENCRAFNLFQHHIFIKYSDIFKGFFKVPFTGSKRKSQRKTKIKPLHNKNTCIWWFSNNFIRRLCLLYSSSDIYCESNNWERAKDHFCPRLNQSLFKYSICRQALCYHNGSFGHSQLGFVI